jgi:3-dehydroquinate synthase
MNSLNSNNGIYFAEEAEQWLRKRLDNNPDRFMLCDTNTQLHCLPIFEKRFGKTAPGHLIVMPAGEAHKQLETVEAIWRQLQLSGARRDSLLMNLGGGVVCDIGGFVAATWKRGIPFIHIPTTLMAQTDAAIGGKCALNLGGIKNQIGLIRQPEAVCILPDFLKSLPQQEIHAGYAEMLKHGIIADAGLFRTLRQTDSLVPPDTALIRRSVGIKMDFVQQDTEDRNVRKALNFGHSIGHLLEALSDGRLSHGEAVAQGMRAETLIAYNQGIISKNDFLEIESALHLIYGDFPKLACSREEIGKLLAADKKCDSLSNNFSLPECIGKVRTDCPVSTEEVWNALRTIG